MLLSEKLKQKTKNGFMLVNDVLIDEVIKLETECNRLSFNECINETGIKYDEHGHPVCPLLR